MRVWVPFLILPGQWLNQPNLCDFQLSVDFKCVHHDLWVYALVWEGETLHPLPQDQRGVVPRSLQASFNTSFHSCVIPFNTYNFFILKNIQRQAMNLTQAVGIRAEHLISKIHPPPPSSSQWINVSWEGEFFHIKPSLPENSRTATIATGAYSGLTKYSLRCFLWWGDTKKHLTYLVQILWTDIWTD